MADYLIIESRDPFESNDVRGSYELATKLAKEGNAVTLFLVQNGELHTPTPDCFLNGLTRQTVMELAKRRQIKVVERAIMPTELAKTDEVFLVGTAAEVTPVGQVGEYNFKVGPVTRQLREDYLKEVRAHVKSAAAE